MGMDRRSFFTSVGALAATPLIGCIGRDKPVASGESIGAKLAELRRFPIPATLAPALPFQPLRRRSGPRPR